MGPTATFESIKSEFGNWNKLSHKEKCELLHQTSKFFDSDFTTDAEISDISINCLGGPWINELRVDNQQNHTATYPPANSLNKINRIISQISTESKYRLSKYYLVSHDGDNFLLSKNAMSSSDILKNCLENSYDCYSGKIKKNIFVLGLSLLAKSEDGQKQWFKSHKKRKDLVEVKEANDFLRFNGALKRTFDIQTRKYIERKWEKHGVSGKQFDEETLLKIVETTPATDAKVLCSYFQVHKSLLKVEQLARFKNGMIKAVDTYFSNHDGSVLDEFELELLKRYFCMTLNKAQIELSHKLVTLWKDTTYNSVQYFLVKSENEKVNAETCVDIALSLKTAFLANALNKQFTMKLVLDKLKDWYAKNASSKEIIENIRDVFCCFPCDLEFREQLLRIIDEAPKEVRTKFLFDSCSDTYDHIRSNVDPLFRRYYHELIEHGFKDYKWGNNSPGSVLMTHCDVRLTIEVCQHLSKRIEDGPNLDYKLIYSAVYVAAENKTLSRDEAFKLFQFALNFSPKGDYGWLMARFIQKNMVNVRYPLDLSSLESKLEQFFESIRETENAYPFMYWLCAQALDCGNIVRAEEIAGWENRITNTHRSSLDPMKQLFAQYKVPYKTLDRS